MKIRAVETLRADAGWRMFSFLKITTDSGIIGWSEFTPRFWSALFSLGTVIAVYSLGKNMFDRRTGFTAGLVYVTSIHVIIGGHIGVMDTALTFFEVLCLLSFFYS